MYQLGDQIMAPPCYRVNGDTFVPEKPRVWIAKFGGGEAMRQWDNEPRP